MRVDGDHGLRGAAARGPTARGPGSVRSGSTWCSQTVCSSPLARPSAMPCASRPGAASVGVARAVAGGEARLAQAAAVGRGRQLEQAGAGDRRRGSAATAMFSSARPAWPLQRALAVDDHDLLAGGAQRVGELADRGARWCPPRWPRRRGCRRRRTAPRRARPGSASPPPGAKRSVAVALGSSAVGRALATTTLVPWRRDALADAQVPDRRLVDRVAVDQQHGVRELEVRHASPAASGRPARAARPAAARRRCAALRWLEPRSSRSSRCEQERLLVGRRRRRPARDARSPAFLSAPTAAAIAFSQLAGISSVALAHHRRR